MPRLKILFYFLCFLRLLNQVIRSSTHEFALHHLTLVIQGSVVIFKVLLHLPVDDFVIDRELLMTIS